VPVEAVRIGSRVQQGMNPRAVACGCRFDKFGYLWVGFRLHSESFSMSE
jgi:hypothetical protein